MRKYRCFYRGKTWDCEAPTSFLAQACAQAHFKAKKSYEITVVLLDTPLDPASL